MTDIFTKEKRSEVMRSIRSKDTGPEMAIRKALHDKGYRYKLHDKNLPGRPDIVMKKYCLAIQVRGCFWHGHTCPDGHIPKSRETYWREKISENKKRDRRNDRMLRQKGWSLLCIWECKCSKQNDITKQLLRIIKVVERVKKLQLRETGIKSKVE